MAVFILLPAVYAFLSSRWLAELLNIKKHRTRVVCSTLIRHRQTPSTSKTNFEPCPMPRYAVVQDQYIDRSKRHQYRSPCVKIWRTLMSGPIQMLSSHRTTTRVDFRVQIYTFILTLMPF